MKHFVAALVRHGDYFQQAGVPSAHQPYPLTPTGERQAAALAGQIHADASARGWTTAPTIDSSCLLRGWQTAKILSDGLRELDGGPYQVECFPALAERSLGSAANLRVDAIEAVLRDDPRCEPPPPDWKAASHYRLPLPGAESLMQAGARVAAHLRARMSGIAEADGATLKLFIGHGAAFRHAAYHLGVLDFDDIARLSMHHASPVYLAWSADGEWRHIGGEWKVRATGEPDTD